MQRAKAPRVRVLGWLAPQRGVVADDPRAGRQRLLEELPKRLRAHAIGGAPDVHGVHLGEVGSVEVAELDRGSVESARCDAHAGHGVQQRCGLDAVAARAGATSDLDEQLSVTSPEITEALVGAEPQRGDDPLHLGRGRHDEGCMTPGEPDGGAGQDGHSGEPREPPGWRQEPSWGRQHAEDHQGLEKVTLACGQGGLRGACGALVGYPGGPTGRNMRYERVHIQAIEFVVPPTEVTTEALERMLGPLYRRLGLSQGLLEALTGVRARRFWSDGTKAHDAATQAARRLIDKHGLPPCGLQALVSTSVCKDYLEPPMASLIGGDLGVGDQCRNFDVGHACLGFMSGMITVANMIELGQIDAALVVAGEGSREVTSATVRRLLKPGVSFATFSENLATLTLGSMAVAALLVNEKHSRHGHRFLGGASLSATNHSRLCLGTATSMKTDAPTLLREGVSLAGRTWAQAQQNLGITHGDVSEFLLHQVGQANHEALMTSLDLPSEKVLRLYVDHGNVGAAGVPFTLATAVEQGRVRAGDTAMLMGIGSGLNCTMLGVQW